MMTGSAREIVIGISQTEYTQEVLLIDVSSSILINANDGRARVHITHAVRSARIAHKPMYIAHEIIVREDLVRRVLRFIRHHVR
jgi:ABC-type iron transport system FetAB ATPase subunit